MLCSVLSFVKICKSIKRLASFRVIEHSSVVCNVFFIKKRLLFLSSAILQSVKFLVKKKTRVYFHGGENHHSTKFVFKANLTIEFLPNYLLKETKRAFIGKPTSVKKCIPLHMAHH